ncbi:zinc finger translocation-associated protein isoform X2 [Amia ocellicauda]
MAEEAPRESGEEAPQHTAALPAITGEQEATLGRSDAELDSGGEDTMNGYKEEEGEEEEEAAAAEGEGEEEREVEVEGQRRRGQRQRRPSYRMAGTNYWSVSTASLDSPYLLSPSAGPRPHGDHREERASRPGRSRIPGRDHRRYYHEYWRTEYLMDFDPQRHGMVCMVCGSSLATLKLSTIKRHIRQKHPDSLLWSPADKEVIRSGWETHLSLEGGRRGTGGSCCGGSRASQGRAEVLDCALRSVGKPSSGGSKRRRLQSDSGRGQGGGDGSSSSNSSVPDTSPRPRGPLLQGPAPTAAATRTLERYLNDSLHAWFRQEFLMEYEAEEGRLVCMVCGSQLPSLHLDHIKSHVLDIHPNSLIYSAEEKHSILQTWAQRSRERADADEGPLDNDIAIKSEPDTDGDDVTPRVSKLYPHETENGDSSSTKPRNLLPGKGTRRSYPERWRLDYLVAYVLESQGFVCMVCCQPMPAPKVSAFRRHIRECHPQSAGLAMPEREALAAAWGKEGQELPGVGEATSEEAAHKIAPAGAAESSQPSSPGEPEAEAEPEGEAGAERGGARAGGCVGGGPRLGGVAVRHGHYPGKDQRRNYQVRWRLEFLMDYDCRRHGLLCMVCGAALATLKVSTIKRHIQQVHPHSLDFGPEERQQALLAYNQTALHFVHSEDCFSALDHHGHRSLFLS